MHAVDLFPAGRGKERCAARRHDTVLRSAVLFVFLRLCKTHLCLRAGGWVGVKALINVWLPAPRTTFKKRLRLKTLALSYVFVSLRVSSHLDRIFLPAPV